jgi:hypothetical protein
MTDKTTKPEEIIQLKSLCADLKIDPRDARQALRLAVKDAKKFPELTKAYKPRQPWQWVKDSPSHKEAQKALAS